MTIEEKTYVLLRRYYFDKLEPFESVQLAEILSTIDEQILTAILARVLKDNETMAIAELSEDELREKVEEIISLDQQSDDNQVGIVHRIRKTTYAVAIAAAIVIALTGLFYFTRILPTTPSADELANDENVDFLPGAEGAILTLSDGTTIVLDSLGNSAGKIVVDGVEVDVRHGMLSYVPKDLEDGKIIYNTMSTPKGRQYQLALSDGTQVWLNAASSITYPIVFARGQPREVVISGEVYFDVHPTVDLPFVVKIDDQPTHIQVLGTAFNVNAYRDKPHVQTTLIEGRVMLNHQGVQQALQPQQQAVTQASNPKITVKNDVDTEHVTAWKEAMFSFKDARLDELMTEFARWYDIDISYHGTVPPQKYSGKIGKNLTLQQVLALLGATHIRYSIEGERKITIHN